MSTYDNYDRDYRELHADFEIYAKMSDFFYRVDEENWDDAAGFAFETVDRMATTADERDIDFGDFDLGYVSIKLTYDYMLDCEETLDDAITYLRGLANSEKNDIEAAFVKARRENGEYDLSYAIMDVRDDLSELDEGDEYEDDGDDWDFEGYDLEDEYDYSYAA